MSVYSAAVLADAPLLYYRLGETSGHFADSGSAVKNTDTETNVTYAQPSLVPSDQTDKAIVVANSANILRTGYSPSQALPFTVEAVVRDDSVDGANRRFAGVRSGAAGFGVGVNGVTNTFKATTWGVKDYIFATSVVQGTTYHLVFVFRADNGVDLYINGSFSENIAFGTPINAAASPFTIGNSGDATQEFWIGSIDEVAMYGGLALSAGRVTAHWNAMSALFTVINGNDAQLSNVNAAGTDVDGLTYKDSIPLTQAELATLLTTAGVLVLPSQPAPTAQLKNVLLREAARTVSA